MRLRALADRQPEGRALVGVQLPGRDDRVADPMPPELADVVGEVVAELARLPRRRLGLVGVSLGGLLAFETARVLERDAAQPADEVCAVAARAPEFWRDYPADPSHDEIDAMMGPGLRETVLGTYVTHILRSDLRLAAGYDSRGARLERTPLRSVAGRRDVVVTEAQMRPWSSRAMVCAGHTTVDVEHYRFLDDDVLPSIVDATFADVLRWQSC